MIDETVSMSESQRYEVYEAKLRNTKEQLIFIAALKTDVPPILGGLREGKDNTSLFTTTHNPEFLNEHDGVRGFLPRAYEFFQYNRIKFQAGIDRKFQIHTEARFLLREFLVKCGVFWSQFYAEIEAFPIQLVMKTYIYSAP